MGGIPICIISISPLADGPRRSMSKFINLGGRGHSPFASREVYPAESAGRDIIDVLIGFDLMF
jgi:hypothetical protein